MPDDVRHDVASHQVWVEFFNTISVSNNLDPDQAQHFVRPDLGPNCLQRL